MRRLGGAALRALSRLTRLVVHLGVAVGALVLALIAQLNAPVVHRVTIARVDQLVFDHFFSGRMRIVALGHVDLGGVSGVNVRVTDPSGRSVLAVDGLASRIHLAKLLRSLVIGPDILVDLPDVSFENVDIRLDGDDAGVALAETFLPPPHPPSPPSEGPPGKGVKLDIPKIRIGHAWVHGQLSGAPYIDGDVYGLEAAFTLKPDGLAADLGKAHIDAHGMALGADAEGSAAGRFELALDDTLAMGGRVTWTGVAGTLREDVQLSLQKGRFDGSVDVPQASPEAIRSVWPASRVAARASELHVEAHGPLDAIAVAAHATMDAASADVKGSVGWALGKRADLQVDVSGLDLHEFTPDVPESALGAHGGVGATLDDQGRLDGWAKLDFPSGHVGPHAVPHATLDTRGFRAKDGAFGGDATVEIDEPGVPTKLVVRATPTGHSSRIDFDLRSSVSHLSRVVPIAAHATGEARLEGKGTVDLERLLVDVSVDTQGRHIRRGPVEAASISIRGSARGHLENPVVDVAVRAQDLVVNQTRWSDVDVTARGPLLRPHVTVHVVGARAPAMDASADVALLDGPAITNAKATVTREGVVASLSADRLRLEGGTLHVADLKVVGLGAPLEATLDVGDGVYRVRARSRGIDVGRAAKLAMLEQTVRAGVLAVDADIEVRGGDAAGHAELSLANGDIVNVGAVSAHLSGTARNHRYVGTAGVTAGAIGAVELDAKELDIPGSGPMTQERLRRAWGDVRLSGRVDLAKLRERLPEDALPVSALAGLVVLKGRFQRDNAGDFTPLVDLDVSTEYLIVSGKSENDGAKGDASTNVPPPWTLAGIDLRSSVRVNGDTGRVDLTAAVHDAQGDLAVLDGSTSDIPYRALYQSTTSAMAALPTATFTAHLAVPSRAVTSWPKVLGHFPVDGDLSADVAMTGSIMKPHVVLHAKLDSVASAYARLTSPVAMDLDATYDGETLGAGLKGQHDGVEVLTADAHASLKAADVIRQGAAAPWAMSAKANLTDFPLVTIGALDDRQIRGRLTGEASIDDLHADARGVLKLAVAGLRVGDAAYKEASAVVALDGKSLRADVELEQVDGSASVKASVPATWGAALAPTPDTKAALELEAHAKHFRAAVVRPFLRGSVDELDGFIDADARVTVDPRTALVGLDGHLELTEGLVELAAFGGELHDISAKVTVTPDGLLSVKDLTAYGVSGELMASLSARLRGLAVVGANATIQIPKGRGIPLTVGGAQFGTVDGKVLVKESITPDHKTINVDVDVPTLHVAVPENGSQDVEALGPIDGVAVGVHAPGDGTFVLGALDPDEEPAEPSSVSRPEDAVTIHIATHLGNDVVIRRDADVRIELSGGPVVTITDKARVTGQVQLKGGILSLYGKNFEIEHGTVSFVGDDPSNPQVSLTAGWTASDGTLVKADFIGPLKTGKVSLRSEPPLPRDEIVQLLLFGTIEGQAASAQGMPAPGTSSAEGVAGNYAAQPLNRALDQFGLSAVSAKVDTSAANAKPEVVVQIAKDISVQLAHILYFGPPPLGTSPDTTLLTIDWRFLRKWSLEATVGNAGSTIVDLVWKHRY